MKRRPPMDEPEFLAYLDEVNRKAEPFVPLINCYACGKPIGDAWVIRTSYDPPIWLHMECDGGSE